MRSSVRAARPRATERSTSSTPARARASACACAWAAPGASRPCAAPTRATPRRRWRARSPWRGRSPRPGGDAAGARAAGPGRVGEPGRARPVRGPARGQARGAARGRRRAARRAGREPHARALRGVRGPTRSFASTEGALCEQRHDRVRRRHRRRGRGRATTARSAPTPPRTAATWPRPATSTSSGSTWPGHAPRVADGGGGAAARAGLPAGPHDADPRRRAARAPDPRVGRPRGGARPRARARGLLRGHELRGPRTAIGSLRFGSELVNVTADATTPGGLGTFRWDDEGVEGRPVPIVRDGVLRRLPLLARDRGRDRARALRRLHARRRLRPPADRADDEREPRAGRRRHARRPDRRHRATAC